MPRISTIFILIFGTLTVTGEITLSMEAVGALTLTVGVFFLAQDLIELYQENNARKLEKELYNSYMKKHEDAINEADATRDFTIDDFYKET